MPAASIITRARRQASYKFIWILAVFYFVNILEVVLVTPWILPAAFVSYLAIAIGSAVIFLPVGFALYRWPGAALPRHVAALAFGFACSLSVASSGGSIAQHFSYFIIMVVLAWCLDWKVLASFTIYVLLDHGLRGMFFFDTVFGCQMWREGQSVWSVAAHHALLIALQLGALLFFINRSLAGLSERERVLGALSKAKSDLQRSDEAKIELIVEGLNKDLLATIKNQEAEATLRATATIAAAELSAVAARTAAAVAMAGAEAAVKVAAAARIAVGKVLQTAGDLTDPPEAPGLSPPR